jgi:organic hydroperoxide reductase OsmC/OhrA
MSDERTHHVRVKLAHGFQFVAEFDDAPNGCPITFDEPEPLGGGRGPTAAAVLGAAVGNCLAASLAFCLRRSHFGIADLTADVTTHVIRNEKGRFRVSGIDVELTPVLTGSGAPRLDRCEGLFEDFCTVTASVKHGIPVHVSLRTAEKRAA